MGWVGLSETRQIPEAHRETLAAESGQECGSERPSAAVCTQRVARKVGFLGQAAGPGLPSSEPPSASSAGGSCLTSGAPGMIPLACCSPPSPQAVARSCGFK